MNKYKISIAGIIAVVGIAAVIQGVGGAGLKLPAIKPTATKTAPMTDEQQAILAVRTAKASVVSIVGTSVINTSTPDQLEQIAGTGVIIDSSGLIVSNSHVVSRTNDSYQVIFSDGTKYDAQVLGMDTYTDVALIKINASGLPAAKLGNSDNLETGQSVFAIGNSLGKYQNTVTRGVVSGLARNVSLGTPNDPKPRMMNLIQTDAAINPGNSGGPLINMSGEVVGINTLIDTGGSGLGFSIPINVIKTAVDQLKTLGRVSHPYLGINFQSIDKTFASLKQLPVDQGAYIVGVTQGAAAAKAGIQAGDIITAIDGNKISENNELDIIIQKYQAGNQVMVTLLRNGETLQLPLILGEFK